MSSVSMNTPPVDAARAEAGARVVEATVTPARELAELRAAPRRGFHGAAFWRRFAYLGAASGPSWFVRFAPSFLGLLFCLLLPEARRAIRRNLRRIYGPRDEAREIVDMARTFQNFAACLAESLGARRAEGRAARVTVRGSERIDRLLAQKTGFVITTAHVGPWDGAAQALAGAEGARVLVVMAHEDDRAAEAVQDSVRGSNSVEVLRIGHHPLDALPALLHLQSGGVVALQLDRVPPGSASIETELFGRAFRVPAGPFLLAGLGQVPLIPVFAARTGFFRRRIEVGHPIAPSRRPSEAERRALAKEVVSQMEAHVRVYPTQWFHFETDPTDPE